MQNLEKISQKTLKRLNSLTSFRQIISMTPQSLKLITDDFVEEGVRILTSKTNIKSEQLQILEAIEKAFDQAHIVYNDFNRAQYDRAIPAYFDELRLDIETEMPILEQSDVTTWRERPKYRSKLSTDKDKAEKKIPITSIKNGLKKYAKNFTSREALQNYLLNFNNMLRDTAWDQVGNAFLDEMMKLFDQRKKHKAPITYNKCNIYKGNSTHNDNSRNIGVSTDQKSIGNEQKQLPR